MSKSSLLSKLYQEATKSLIDKQLAAGLLKAGKLISKPCCNSQRNVYRGNMTDSLHAEAHAILKYYGKSLTFDKKKGWGFISDSPKKLDLVVVRVNKLGEVCNARPCHRCLDMMKAVGIRKVYYSISEKELVCENVKDMISIHVSSIAKQIMDINMSEPTKYYEQLLKKTFPNIVRKHNLEKFINYNLSNVLPSINIIFKKDIVLIAHEKKLIVRAVVIP